MNAFKAIYLPALVAALATGSAADLRAADNNQMPVSGSFTWSPGPMAGPSCPSCGGGSFSSGSSGCKSCQGGSCGGSWFKPHDKGPFVVNLCPGSCFGYFQTQWRRWDEVCPYPYQGIGVSDAPKPPAPALPAVTAPGGTTTPGTLPGPRPVDPKTPGVKPMSYNYNPAPQNGPGYGNQ